MTDEQQPAASTDEACDDSKSAFESKTMWAAALTALVPLIFPPAAAVIAANPALVSAVVGLVFAGLRVTTSGKKVKLKKQRSGIV